MTIAERKSKGLLPKGNQTMGVRLVPEMFDLVARTAAHYRKTPAEMLRLLVMREAVWLETGIAPGHPLFTKEVKG